MRIAILSNVNMDMLIKSLKKQHEVFSTEGYGQWISYALDEDQSLKEFNPECIFLLLDGNALLETSLNFDNGLFELKQVVSYVDKLAKYYENSVIALSTIDVQPKYIQSGDQSSLAIKWIETWDSILDELIIVNKNIHRFELKNIIDENGRKNIYSEKMWYMGSIPYSVKSIGVFIDAINNFLVKLQIVRKKLLILDLDNTLWGGVVGEDGAQGVVLGNSLLGAAYRDAQTRIKEMAQTGVLLAIASKNNIEEVKAIFKDNPHMVLNENDFVAIYADWNPKFENIRAMGKQLNLGLDSFVFLDDNNVERESVKINLPEVTVPDFPSDITSLPNTINKIYENYFWVWRQTGEDKVKTKQYQQEALRKQEMDTVASIDDYLLSLDIKIEIGEMWDKVIERTVQLFNKTNQFNTCTVRMDLSRLMEYKKKPNHFIYVVNVSDKYGDSGLVAILLVHLENEIAIVDNFLMSCRVMGRKIEDAILRAIESNLEIKGVSSIRTSYIPTVKNKPVEKLWDRLGYTMVSQDNAGKKDYILNLDEKQTDSILKVNWR